MSITNVPMIKIFFMLCVNVLLANGFGRANVFDFGLASDIIEVLG